MLFNIPMNNNSELTFDNQVCLVTGSSQGIGREIALELARRNATIIVNYNNSQDEAEKTAEEIRNAGSEAITLQADVSSPYEVKALIDWIYSTYNRLDLLVHNVGLFALQTLAETSIDDWHRMMSTNLNSAFYCVNSALPQMKKRQGGHFVFIGSSKADSTRARHNAGAYGITKTGIVLLAKTLAREEGSNGIRANIINPGAIAGGWATDERREELIEAIPLHRLGKASDIAGAVVYLHSELGAYCNGSVINVDGGLWL